MPESRVIIRGGVIGLGLIALVGVSILAGRLSSQEQPAEAQQPVAAEQTPGPDSGGHDEHGQSGGDSPVVQQPDQPVKPWSKSVTYTDAGGHEFTVLVELEAPTTAGMGMCSVPQGDLYGRTVVLSIRNDSKETVAGPKIGVKDDRIAFPHGKYGCSWTWPPGVDADYPAGDVKTFRGLVKTEPEDVVLVVSPDVDTSGLLPADGEFTDEEFDAAVAKAEAATAAATEEVLRIPAAAFTDEPAN